MPSLISRVTQFQLAPISLDVTVGQTTISCSIKSTSSVAIDPFEFAIPSGFTKVNAD